VKPGDVVAGRFEIAELAGAGGVGRVYRARDRASGGAVALKILAHDAERHRERFAREAQLLDRLRHPAIVGHVAHGVTETGELFLAMEWLDGEDLARRLSRGPLSVAETLALGRRMLTGLAAAHALGVIHRDIKPSNVYLEAGAPVRAKLLDFGIARFRDAVTTLSGVMIGTVGYMAPEQARAARDLDPRADVFATGCVLFECLAGRAAFQGDHAVAVLARIIYDETPRVSLHRRDVPPALDDLLVAAMAKRAEDRPSDAGAFERALAQVGELVGPEPASRSPVALTGREHRRLYVILGARPDDLATGGVGTTAPERDLRELRRRLERDTRPFGVHVEVLADGTAVATLAGGGSATDDAVAAARCALLLRAALPDAPIALVTGSGNLAGGIPVGGMVDRAALLLRDARPAIWTDDAMAALLDARFDIAGGSAGFELRRERDPAEAIHTLIGKPSPCVGRDREIAVLAACFRECVEDEIVRAVVITGPPGIGKSRLIREHIAGLERAEPRPELWIARGDAMSAEATFGMLAQLVRRAARIRDGEPAAVRACKLRDHVRRHVPAARAGRVVALLAELAGIPADEVAGVAGDARDPAAAIDPPPIPSARHDAVSLGDQMRGAFRELLAAECAIHPVVIVLEDLHWGDAATVTALDESLRDLQGRRLFIVAAARPEIHDLFPRLWAGRAVTRLELDVLPRRAGERLIHAMLGTAVPGTTVEKILGLASGNAFYLEELIRTVAAGRTEGLPDTVLAMVDARIETLGSDARRVLRAASVFGDVFYRAGVAALLGVDRAASCLAAALAELREQELIECRLERRIQRGLEPRFSEHDEFGFRHELVREAAYRRLLAADRALGHALAGDWLERAGESDASVLAEHFDKGGAPARAVAQYLRASQDALRGPSFDRGIALAERGVACGAAGRELGALRMVQTEAYAMRLELVDCARTGTEALGLLARGTGEWFSAVGAVMMSCALRDDRERSGPLLDELIATDPQPGAMVSCMVGYSWAMMVLAFSGRYARAAALLTRAECLRARLAPEDRAVDAFLAQLQWWAACSAEPPWHLLRLARNAVALCEASGYSGFRPRAYADLGMSLLALGAHDEAERALGQGLEIANRFGMVHATTVLRMHLGATLLEVGRLDEAEQLLVDVREICRRAEDRYYVSRVHIYLAVLRAKRGDLDGAEWQARQAIDFPCVRPVRAHASAVLAAVMLAQGRTGAARDAALEAKRLFDALGGVHEGDTLIHLMVAETLTRADHPDAAAARRAARDRLMSRAATIDDPALRASFLAADPSARTLALSP
jgi:tetratricopeptide (TPR) repeat protein